MHCSRRLGPPCANPWAKGWGLRHTLRERLGMTRQRWTRMWSLSCPVPALRFRAETWASRESVSDLGAGRVRARNPGLGRAGQGRAGAAWETRRPEPRREVFRGPGAARSAKRGGPQRDGGLLSSWQRLHFLLFSCSLAARLAPRRSRCRCHCRCHPGHPPPPELQPESCRAEPSPAEAAPPSARVPASAAPPL